VLSRQRLIVLLAVLAPRAWMDRSLGRLAAPVKFKFPPPRDISPATPSAAVCDPVFPMRAWRTLSAAQLQGLRGDDLRSRLNPPGSCSLHASFGRLAWVASQGGPANLRDPHLDVGQL
jgi:hypothetical protein